MATSSESLCMVLSRGSTEFASHVLCVPVLWATTLVVILSSIVLGGEAGMEDGAFVSHTVVQAALGTDTEARAAIGAARDTLPEFASASQGRGLRQVDFVVTAMRRDGSRLLPVGILVEQIDAGRIEGREIENALVASPAHATSCNTDHVIDWRYTDAFECIGARLYRVILRRQPPIVQVTIEESQPFLLDWYLPMDADFRDLCRDVANLRYVKVQRRLILDRSLAERRGFMPIPGRLAPRQRLNEYTLLEYAAEFGDRRIIRLLDDLGLLREAAGAEAALSASAWSGNIETAQTLLERGFDVESDEGAPLRAAVRAGHEQMVQFLLECGADCNRPHHRGRTPLFGATTIAVAMRLLAAGARVDLTDDAGRTTLQWYLQHGRVDLVEVLRQHGAGRAPAWNLGRNDAQVREVGKNALREHFGATDLRALEEFELSLSIDYGCILPVRYIALSGREDE